MLQRKLQLASPENGKSGPVSSLAWEDSPHNREISQCHQAAIRETVGRINAAGLAKEVTFEPVSRKINEVLGHC
jgi:hypothetical protein